MFSYSIGGTFLSKYDDKIDVHFTSSMIKDNTEFLLTYTKDNFEVIIDFVNESGNFPIPFDKEKWAKYNNKYALAYFGTYVLFPLSLAIKTDLQIGNTPACFFELRMMLESMAKCYWADIKYPDKDFFLDKITALHKNMNGRISISQLLKNIEPDYGALWRELSNTWLHHEGFVSKINQHIIKNNIIPSYAIGSPMPYVEEDIETINELGSQVSSLRTMLKETSIKWRKELKI